jgi:hypothetical protein
MRAEPTAERAIVLQVLDRECTHAELERIVGPGATDALKALAADGVVIRHGERVWASPAVYRLDELGLIAV